jgi:hypothetical protein
MQPESSSNSYTGPAVNEIDDECLSPTPIIDSDHKEIIA